MSTLGEQNSQLEAPSSKLKARPDDSASSPEPAVQQIRDLVATWASASGKGDLEAIKSLMDEDILFLTAGNEPFGRETFIQHFNNNVKQMNLNVRADVREVEVRDDLAFARTWLEVRITPPQRRTSHARGLHALDLPAASRRTMETLARRQPRLRP